MLLGCACGLMGGFLLLRKRSLMGDTLSHATLPGVCLAFFVGVMLGGQGKSLPLLLLGATVTGVLAAGGECMASDQVTVTVEEPPQPPMTCSDIKPITALSMVWDGPSGVDIVTEAGQQFNDVQHGNQITFSTVGLGNDVDLTLSGAVNGSSAYHVSCSDKEMNGSEDCGSNQGNNKGNDASLINTWLFDGMSGEKGAFECGLDNSGVIPAEPGFVALEDGGKSGK